MMMTVWSLSTSGDKLQDNMCERSNPIGPHFGNLVSKSKKTLPKSFANAFLVNSNGKATNRLQSETPARLHSFHGGCHEIISMAILSFLLFQKGSCQLLTKVWSTA